MKTHALDVFEKMNVLIIHNYVLSSVYDVKIHNYVLSFVYDVILN
jgi:hypothetical protein